LKDFQRERSINPHSHLQLLIEVLLWLQLGSDFDTPLFLSLSLSPELGDHL